MMNILDLHTHHPSRQGERVILQDVDSLAVHPWHAADADVEQVMHNIYERLKNDEAQSIVSIGECGLDKLCTVPMQQQINIFRRHIAWSKEFHLPLIIHCVRAWDELLALKKEYAIHNRSDNNCDAMMSHSCSLGGEQWIIHGFRGKPQLMQQLLKAGFYLSFGFLHHEESLRLCPPNRRFFETDEDERSVIELYNKYG